MAFNKSQKFTFKNLENKYGSFLSPIFKIKVGNKQLDSDKVPISHLQIQLTTENKAAMCSFTIEAMYDYEKSSWGEGIMDAIDVGKKVTIEAGYATSQTRVFLGYVDQVRVDYTSQAAPQIHVSAMDGLGLLMSEKEKVDFGQKTTKAVVQELVAACQTNSLTEGSLVDTLPDFKMSLVKEDGCSTYEYLCQLAELCFMNFCIINGTLIYSNLMKNTAILITLTMGKNLIEFSKTVGLNSQMVSKVTVISTGDTATQEEVRGVADSPSRYGSSTGRTAAEKWKALKGATRDMRMDFLKTAEECKTVAQNVLDTMSLGLIQGNGRCIGLPELVPGRYIDLSGMDKKTNGSYFVTAVTHTFSEDGFFTEFEVKGFRN